MLSSPLTLAQSVRASTALLVAFLFLAANSLADDRVTTARSGIDLDAIDHSIRPQDNFYAFVNGRWLEQTAIPPGATSISMRTIMQQQTAAAIQSLIEELSAFTSHSTGSEEQLVSDFFRSYMNSDLVEDLGIAPIADELAAIRNASSITELLATGARLRREGIRGPIEVVILPDLSDPGRYTAVLRQDGLSLPAPDYYLDNGAEFSAVRDGLPDYAARLFELAGLPDPETRAQAVLGLESKLAAAHQPVEQTRDVAGYNPYPIDALEDVSRHLDWTSILEAMGLEDETQIVISAPAYMERLGQLFDSEPLDHWKHYWTFQLLNARAELLPEAFVAARFEYLSGTVRGVTEQQPRSVRAARLISGELFRTPGVLEWPVAKLYVDRHLAPDAKDYLDEMIENLRSAYRRSIDGLDWMSEETKAEARRKLENLVVRIAFPDEWPDYSGLAITPDDLIGNARRAFAYEYALELGKLSRGAKRSDWANYPHWMYAYAGLDNSAEFPAAFLQPPLFVPGNDDAYNYAGVGFVIGHELGHNFDNQGRKMDADGSLRDWWSDADELAFRQRANRLISYYNAFEPLPGMNVNGEMTLAENIADLAGLTVAYDAYVNSLQGEEPPVIDGFTGAQRFMITYARICRSKTTESALRQTLLAGWGAPWKQRANGPLRHFAEFYRAFDVREGDGMWLAPEERVKIW